MTVEARRADLPSAGVDRHVVDPQRTHALPLGCGHCGMVLDPGRDRHNTGAPIDGMHPECAAWTATGRRHLLLEPELWGDPLLAASRAAA